MHWLINKITFRFFIPTLQEAIKTVLRSGFFRSILSFFFSVFPLKIVLWTQFDTETAKKQFSYKTNLHGNQYEMPLWVMGRNGINLQNAETPSKEIEKDGV